MLSSFYYYSLASPDHLCKGAYQLNIISAAISSLIRKALLCYWSLLVLHQQPARGWVLYNTSQSSGNGSCNESHGQWHELQSIRKTLWNVDRMILLRRVPGSGISKSGKFLVKLRAHHSGKFAPRGNKPVIQ